LTAFSNPGSTRLSTAGFPGVVCADTPTVKIPEMMTISSGLAAPKSMILSFSLIPSPEAKLKINFF
jgi:hypothetical protein